MKDREKFLTKFQQGPVFLKYDFEKTAVRFDPTDGYFLKFKEEQEIRVPRDNRLVSEAILEQEEISEEEYKNW